ncbi:SRPBCC domain-containing protein [Streptomyces cavourensis]|nr:SRPBCC domain-containing protein [Streptomyces cavourensis]
MGSVSFSYELYIFNTSPARTYDALISPEDIRAYMLNTGPQSTWGVGDKVLWKSEADGVFQDLDQTVTKASPGEELAYTWHRIQPMHRDLFPNDDDYETARKEQTEVSWSLSPFADGGTSGTRVILRHRGFDSKESVMLQGLVEGWAFFMSSLKTHLEAERPANASRP